MSSSPRATADEKSMFLPRSSAPPKEGRLRPGAPRYGPPSSQIRTRRAVILALLLALGIFTFVFLRSDTTAISSRLPTGRPAKSAPNPNAAKAPAFQKGEQAVQAHEEEVKKEAEAASGVKSHAEVEKAAKAKAAAKKEDEEVLEEEAETPKPKPAKPAAKTKSPAPAAGARLPAVEKALEKVLKLLPDEFTMRELLRPFEGGGKERMRELGMRTRQYKNFFDAWEELHLVDDGEGRLSVRDDIVQLLRAGSLTEPGKVGNEALGHMVRSYESFRSFVGKLASALYPFTTPYFADHVTLHAYTKSGGRGIALTAGDEQAPMLMTVIHSIRNVGCNLPIEVLYLGDKDLGEDYRSQLEELDGVITRDIAQMVTDDGWELAGWAAKPYAILLSSFREVIFIDADSFFLQNPEIMFEDPGYKETGALFFRDRLILPESKKRFLQQLLPKPIPKAAKQSRFWTGESGHQQESGVLVVDKWRHFLSMLLTCRLNGSDRDTRDGKTGVYELMYGDKETFWLGFLLAGDESFSFHLGDAAAMGIIKEEDDHAKPKEPAKADAKPEDKPKEDEKPLAKRAATPKTSKLCAPQLLHLDMKGKPLWFNGGLVDNKFADKKMRKLASFKTYLAEPKELREPTPWQLGESNMACLDSEHRFDFTEAELKLLQSLLDHHKAIKEKELRS